MKSSSIPWGFIQAPPDVYKIDYAPVNRLRALDFSESKGARTWVDRGVYVMHVRAPERKPRMMITNDMTIVGRLYR